MRYASRDMLKWPASLRKLPVWLSTAIKNARTLLRVFSFASSGDRIFLVISTIASICAGATLPLMNILFAQLVESFSSIATASPENTVAAFIAVINEYVLYIVYLFIGRLLLCYIAIFGFRITSLRISASIRLSYLQALFKQPISTLDALPPGQTTAIITITANILQLGISERLSSLIQATSVITVALIIGCCYSWALTLVTATGLVAIVVWYQIITPLVVQRYAEVQKVETEAAGAAFEALSGIRMIAACGAEDKIMQSYTKLVERMKSMSRKLSPVLAVQHSPVFFATYATFALCFWFAVRLYIQAEFVNIKTLVVVLMSVLTMLAHISAVSVPLTAAYNAINAASIFFTIIDAPKVSTSGCKREGVSLDADITLDNINFSYPLRHDVKVLNGLTLRIPAGKTTAIVGPSGSGKSTTVALIQRWYELGSLDPIANFLRNGTIKIGDKDLNEINLYWWRSRIGFVQQEPYLFNDTIYKNVEYGLVGTNWEYASHDVKEHLVKQACREAYADDFILRLPEGYYTSVGEVGSHLSGGQRQRIAIARAIVRQPEILIFDEATSALDVTSERIVQAALSRAARNRTTIVIAHRLSTIKDADQIVVMAKGIVVEQGTHRSLLSDKNGAYSRLVNVQQLSTCLAPMKTDDLRTKRPSVRKGVVIKDKTEEVFEDFKPSVPAEPEEVKMQSPGIFRSFLSLLMEQKANWLGYLVMIIAAFGAAASTPLQAYLFGRLISSFASPINLLSSSVNFLCLMLLVVAIGVGLSYFTIGWVSNTVSVRTVTFYRKDYLHNMITKRISFFDHPDHSVGLLTTRLATDPAQLQQLLGTNMAMALISVFSLIGCVVVAGIFHWKFALVVMVSSLPIILVGGWYRVRHEVQFEAKNSEVFAESARFATEAIGAIRTVASLTLERTVCRKYADLLESHLVMSWKQSRLSCLLFAASDSMVLLCMAFALWYGGQLLAKLEIQPFNFLVVYLAIIQGSLAAGQWLSFGPNVAQVSAAADRIQNMRLVAPDDEEFRGRNKDAYDWKIPNSLLWKGADIEFHKVWFTYPTRNVPVLRGLTMRICHGQFVAIVGSSGSGKTTVISLLERFYEPEKGSIRYNSDNIAKLPLRVLRQRMSLVAQEPCLFRGTIRDNVLLGMEDDMVDENKLHQACRDSGIHDFIMSLPDGYETDIGTGGVLLSGGQKQRISIARALIRNPSVLLLDEATSSLDSEAEKEVQAVFEQSGKGRTMIVVAHRLATIQKADLIFVLHQGSVVEQGNHQGLLRRKGVYWQMCQGQALGI